MINIITGKIQRLSKTALCLLVCLSVISAGCSLTANEDSNLSGESSEKTVSRPAAVGVYDSEDTAVIVKKDMEASSIQLQNIGTSRRYTLSFGGTTPFYDKYDNPIAASQLKEGSIVTVRFMKDSRTLSYCKVFPDALSLTGVSKYSMDLKNGTLSVGDNIYNISGHVVVASDSSEADMMDINQMDVLSIYGYKNMIYGINVEKGHGYLRLKNQTYFLDGWLGVGDDIITTIKEDMLVVVPEGTHDVTVSAQGSSASQRITFKRGEEMAWDLGQIEITVLKKGSIVFALTPPTASVTIDGKAQDVSKPVELTYGLHQMKITAEGYEPVAQYIKVAEPSASISVELIKSKEESSEEAEGPSETTEENVSKKKYESAQDSNSSENKSSENKSSENKSSENNGSENSSSENNSSGDSASDKNNASEKDNTSDGKDKNEDSSKNELSSSGYKVYIDEPQGAEVYLDGNYIGIAPIGFDKKAGNYVITLRKSGCQTRSYTLRIDDEKKDVNYSFAQLKELEE